MIQARKAEEKNIYLIAMYIWKLLSGPVMVFLNIREIFEKSEAWNTLMVFLAFLIIAHG